MRAGPGCLLLGGGFIHPRQGVHPYGPVPLRPLTPMNVCTVCRSPRRGDIDRALLAGDPVRDVAANYGCSKSAVSRHAAEHIAKKLASASMASEISSAGALLARLDRISEQTDAILAEARGASDHKTSLRAIARLEKQCELTAKMVGLIQQAPVQVQIVMMPEWVQLRTVIIAAVAPYPKAAAAVLEAMESIDVTAE